jgi:hypothetical protein
MAGNCDGSFVVHFPLLSLRAAPWSAAAKLPLLLPIYSLLKQ